MLSISRFVISQWIVILALVRVSPSAFSRRSLFVVRAPYPSIERSDFIKPATVDKRG